MALSRLVYRAWRWAFGSRYLADPPADAIREVIGTGYRRFDGRPPPEWVFAVAVGQWRSGFEAGVEHIEREYIAEALRRAGGVKVKAAELLGMSFRSFRYYMKKYDLK